MFLILHRSRDDARWKTHATRSLDRFRSAEHPDVLLRREIGFSLRLQSCHPAPTQRVARRIRIEQMIHEKFCPQHPWQSGVMDPIRCPPHPRVVVQIPRLHQLPCKIIHDPRSRTPLFHLRARLPLFDGLPFFQFSYRSNMAIPRHRTPLQPPLPISAPHHLLQKFFDRAERMTLQRRLNHLPLRDQPVRQSRRQTRNVFMSRHHKIALRRIARRPPEKLLQPLQGELSRGGKMTHSPKIRRPHHKETPELIFHPICST